MRQVAELAARRPELEVKALAEKAVNLLRDIQDSKQSVISDVHKESLFDLLDAVKQHLLSTDKPYLSRSNLVLSEINSLCKTVDKLAYKLVKVVFDRGKKGLSKKG